MLLVDTHILIWFLSGSGRLKPAALELLQRNAGSAFYSMVSLWEVAFAQSKNRLKEFGSPTAFERDVRTSGFVNMPFETGVLDVLISMPFHHRDPHDRLLIAQAKYHDLTLMTADPWFEEYDIKVARV